MNILTNEEIYAIAKAEGEKIKFRRNPNIDIDFARAIEQAMIAKIGTPVEIDWPEYHNEGMGCGLEDRGITDRYEAMYHGWDCAVERCAEAIPDIIYTIPFLEDK